MQCSRLLSGSRGPCQALCCLHRATKMMQVIGRKPLAMQKVCRHSTRHRCCLRKLL